MKPKSLRRDIPLSILVDLLIQIVFVMTILWVVTGIESSEKDDIIADLESLPGEANELKKEIVRLKAEIKVLKEKLDRASSGKESLLATIEELEKEIEEKSNQIAKLIRGESHLFWAGWNNDHVATFHFYG